MEKTERPQSRFLGLLICLLFLFIVIPFLGEFSPANLLAHFITSAILLFSVYSFINNKKTLLIISFLAAPAFISNWVSYVSQTSAILFIKDGLNAIFFGYIIVFIIIEIFRKKAVTLDLIYGSICVYLLIGVVWAFVYSALENIFPGSFHFSFTKVEQISPLSTNHIPLMTYLYYSFVTLSTLGYGDVTPVTPPAQSMATLEAITGQFYLAILVARMVGMYISSNSKP
jgi:Ion channel